MCKGPGARGHGNPWGLGASQEGREGRAVAVERSCVSVREGFEAGVTWTGLRPEEASLVAVDRASGGTRGAGGQAGGSADGAAHTLSCPRVAACSHVSRALVCPFRDPP